MKAQDNDADAEDVTNPWKGDAIVAMVFGSPRFHDYRSGVCTADEIFAAIDFSMARRQRIAFV